MGKLSKKLKKAAMAGIALYGASKLMSAKGKGVSDTYAKAKKAMTTDRAYGKPGNISKSMGAGNKINVRTLPESSLKKYSLRKDGTKGTRNMKSIFVQDDGSIIQGNKQYMNKDAFKNRNKNKPGGLKDFANKFILGRKTQLNKGGMTQGYNARLDESLGARNGAKSQSLKARRDESKGMEKAMGKGAYSGASTMAKKGKMIKARGGVMVKTKLNGNLYTETF